MRVRDPTGRDLSVLRTVDDPQLVPEPLDGRSRVEDHALQGVLDVVVQVPRDGRQEARRRQHAPRAGVHDERTRRAVGGLHVSRLVAGLAKERSLLVSDDSGDGDTGAEGRVRCRVAVDLGGRADRGQHLGRDGQFRQQCLVPGASIDVEQECPRGVRAVGHVDGPTGQVPDEPRVHGAEEELATLGTRLRLGHVIEDPAELGAREVGVDHQAGRALDVLLQASRLQLVAQLSRATILPDDRVHDRPARIALPHDRRLALVGDADPGDLLRACVAQLQHTIGDGELTMPDVLGVVFHPARAGDRPAQAPGALRPPPGPPDRRGWRGCWSYPSRTP